MSESIGAIYETLIPSLSESADVQEAFRLYHYGAPSGTGSGEYDPTNTNAGNLVNPSIAYTLNSLQSQITSISGSLGVQATNWGSKGVIVTASAPNTLYQLTVGANGTFLSADSTASGGLSWQTVPVTLTNTVTLTNKTLTAPKISSASFLGDSNGNELIAFPSTVASAVNEITVTNAATSNKPTISATGGDTNITLNLVSKGTGTIQANGVDIVTLSDTQTLTNKTLSNPTITNNLYLSSTNSIVFEGATDDAFETTLTAADATFTDKTVTLPNATTTLVGTDTADTLTNKTLENAKINAWNTSYTGSPNTLTLTDASKVVLISHTSQSTINVPTNASVAFPIGTQILIVQTGVGKVLIAGSGVTFQSTPGLYLRAQYSSATLIKIGENQWLAIGDLAAS